MPTIARRALDGTDVDTSELPRRPTVVKFFAKWCEPCRRTLPAFAAMAREHRDVAFVGIALDEHESDVRALVRQYALSMPVVHDRARAIAGRFRVVDLPMTFVSGADGTIRWVGGAEQSESDLEAAVRSYAR
jgi:cytochrome c biogenesis protein CcmG/thiol:disulfide interchange protein DsbE